MGRAGWLLVAMYVASGCTGFARHWQRDDIVSARQIALRGMDAQQAGDWRQAEALFGRAVEVCPVDERVRSRYAEALWRRGARSEALVHMREAVRLSGEDPELLVRLGEMYLAVGDLDDAQQLAERTVRSGRQLARAYRLQGDVLRGHDAWRDALAAYHRALSLQSHFPEVEMAVAQVYLQHNRPQRALATLQALAAKYPRKQEPVDLIYDQALAYMSLHRYNEAADRFAAAAEGGLRTADVLYRLAEARLASGDLANAHLALQRATELQAAHPAAARLSAAIKRAQATATWRR